MERAAWDRFFLRLCHVTLLQHRIVVPLYGDNRLGAIVKLLESRGEKEVPMCVSCGCGEYENDHGDKRNITMKELEEAAAAAGTTVQKVGQNIQDGSQQVGARRTQG